MSDVDGEVPRHIDGVRFRFTRDHVGWIGICNALGGGYRIDEGRLVVDQIGGTEQGCDELRDVADSWVADLLRSGPKIHLDGDRLTLTGEEVTLVAEDTGERLGSLADP